MSDSVPCPSTPHTVSPTSARSVSVGAAEFAGPLPCAARRPPSALCPWEDTQGSRAWCSSAPCRELGSVLPSGSKRSGKGPCHAPPRAPASHRGLEPPPARLWTMTGSGKRGIFPTVARRVVQPDPFRGPVLRLKMMTNNRRSHRVCSTPTLVSTPSQSPRSYDF